MDGVKPARFSLPHPFLFTAFLLCWVFFLFLGKLSNIDTHFTYQPENYPQYFTVSPWQPSTITTPSGQQSGLIRIATCPLTFFTLRYTYWSSDGGNTRE